MDTFFDRVLEATRVAHPTATPANLGPVDEVVFLGEERTALLNGDIAISGTGSKHLGSIKRLGVGDVLPGVTF